MEMTTSTAMFVARNRNMRFIDSLRCGWVQARAAEFLTKSVRG
jgi:hypothetical protein